MGSADMRKKITLLIALILIVSASLFAYYPSRQLQPLTKVAIGTTAPNSSCWPIYIAKDSAIFEKYGLDASIASVSGGKDVIISLVAGQIQIGAATSDIVVAARLEGLDVVQIGAMETGPAGLYLVTRPEITSVQQLRGKVGAVVTVGAGLGYLAMVTMLRQLGFDPMNDVTIIAVSGATSVRFAALQAGKVDFMLTSQVLKAKELGLNVLLNVADVVQGIPGNAYVVSTEYLKHNREIAERFMKAVTEAVRFFFGNKEESKRILGRWMMENDSRTLEQDYQDWSKVALRVPANSLDQMRKVLDAMAPFTSKAASADPNIFIDNSIVQELEDEGFFKRIWES